MIRTINIPHSLFSSASFIRILFSNILHLRTLKTQETHFLAHTLLLYTFQHLIVWFLDRRDYKVSVFEHSGAFPRSLMLIILIHEVFHGVVLKFQFFRAVTQCRWVTSSRRTEGCAIESAETTLPKASHSIGILWDVIHKYLKAAIR